ncbi:hypothetical protein F4824DRAFT_475351 [Ustulina deusta]|nr:hypothetical protein F4824DRAFT_475351 [Ustulina deusta]
MRLYLPLAVLCLNICFVLMSTLELEAVLPLPPTEIAASIATCNTDASWNLLRRGSRYRVFIIWTKQLIYLRHRGAACSLQPTSRPSTSVVTVR